MDHLELNGKKFYYEEIAAYSFRNSIPINGYEAKVLEFCRNWLNGQQEFVVHTSGSTGPPKNITLTRTQMEASARRTIAFLQLQAGDRVLVSLNVEAISGMMMVVRGLVADLHLTIIEPIGNPLAFSKPEQPFDFISLVPYQLQTIISESPAKKLILDMAKAILVGGAPVTSELAEAVKTVKAPVYHSYGMTETVSHIALRRLNGPEPELFYKAFPDIKLSLDERGCLTIKGDITNNQTIVTNDLVTLHDAHTFEWLGRADNTINTGGYKVQLEKVEVALAQILIKLNIGCRSFVTAVPEVKLGSKLVAVLEGKTLPEEIENNIKKELAHFLHKYELPKQYLYTKNFKSTASGKTDKAATLQQLQQQ
ncbi:O-succinylbenzoic acid--CoA ligase [Adhaeribacter aerolatus]|uniref:O-succinylbenzoic acid--CoA ligase n=1 Tax=Adhaeribacter aerolatus TaxID=670289 RepID=A0A512B4M6_9BACT|nr:AMP-binding protein [Adhaeribacter aerolatus]GEO06909.1 O-succinylbenzoic acid--CoA ligase [Adhaeribacter aerolatus]